jgi:hypothetical protein
MNPEALLNLVTIIWASLLNLFRKPSAVANDASKFSIEYGRNSIRGIDVDSLYLDFSLSAASSNIFERHCHAGRGWKGSTGS